jgi:hypothetical protein
MGNQTSNHTQRNKYSWAGLALLLLASPSIWLIGAMQVQDLKTATDAAAGHPSIGLIGDALVSFAFRMSGIAFFVMNLVFLIRGATDSTPKWMRKTTASNR